MTSVYRERDRYDDSRSVASTRRDDGDRTYTKVTRYVVREDDDDIRSNYTSRRRESPERERETIRITRREVDDRESVAPSRRNIPAYVERDLSIHGREQETRSPRPWEPRDETTDREIVIRRTEDRDDGPRRETDRASLAVTRVDDRRDSRGYDYDVYRSGDYGRDRDLQHYTRTSEYYAPQQPQTIIIRQDPIIIRERVRDDDYQLVRKSDVDEERSVATTRREEPRDEEYFYEKRVRERFDDPRDDYDRKSRREVSPHDSISQVGRRRDDYSSDDSMVYVRRVEKEGYSRDSSRENKKDLAAGVIAGVGAAELLRNHRKKEGKEATSGIGRVGQDIGAGAVGALAAEGIRRYRSKSRHGSRGRDRSDSRDRYDRRGGRGRSRSRSRSSSNDNLKKLGALGLGAVAVAAIASYAARKNNNNNQQEEKAEKRSRSRRRRGSRGSVESLSDLENDPTADDARNPKKRNQRIAAAGAVGAAAGALLDRARSKSRGGEGSRERSQSRVRQGLPIAVAGLGTAAIAGLYEKNKAKKEAEEIQAQQKKERARSRSGNRRSDTHQDNRSRSIDPSWVEYGTGEVAGNNLGPEYYGRGAPQEPYYGDGAMVPSGRTRSRSRSVSRDRRGIRSRSHSSARDPRHDSVAGAAAGAIAASEHEKRKAEKRERKARRRAQENQSAGRDPYEDAYASQPTPQPMWSPPPPNNDPYANHQGFGNQYQSQYPPPPGSMPQGLPNQYQPQYQSTPTPQPGPYTPQTSYTPQPQYNPQTYPPPPPPPSAPPAQQGWNEQYHGAGANQFAQQPRDRGAPNDNVSAGRSFSQLTPSTNDQRPFDGVNETHSINPMPVPPAPTPAIHIQPPTNASTPSLNIPQSYVPPAAESHFLAENEQGSTRHVQFASSPETSRAPTFDKSQQRRSSTQDSDDLSPDARRQRRRQHDANRGYEAGDDTDLSPNTERRASKHGSSREQSDDRGVSNSSRRDRNGERSLDPDNDDSIRRRSSDSRRDRRSSRSNPSKDRPSSPADSDATVDLPLRFDDKGLKKPEKGTAGKVFGNFMDGLFGPDGRDRRGSDNGEGSGRRR